LNGGVDLVLSTANISKSFAGETLIEDADILINEGEKAALVGINGSGKTTFLKIVAGEMSPDSGIVTFAKNTSFAYLKQINNIDTDLTIEEELTTVIKPILDMEERFLKLQEEISKANEKELDALYAEYDRLQHALELNDAYMAKSKLTGILKGLGFIEEEFSRKVSTLSGGQKTRVYLAKILLTEPDIILLDEPTNHLDLSSIEWLESYLNNYKKAVLIVSHDRYFLDKIVTKVIDIDNKKVETYNGNYTEFIKKKKELKESAMRAYLNREAQIKRQEEVIEKLKSFNREKSVKRAESRQKALDRIERIDKPTEERSDMDLFFSQSIESGKDVLHIEGLSKSFDHRKLFENVNIDVKRGEHIAILGDNGTGKTTLLKILNNLTEPDSGYIRFGTNVSIAYYDQEHQVLDRNKTIFDEIHDEHPDMNNTEVRNVLASFLFTGDEVFKPISSLSGGERGRVSLAKIMLSTANLIILDEPTNHLDITSKEILENAIREFKGTVIYVSHDRYFINQTATRILYLKDNKFYNYIGDYDYYLEKKSDVESSFIYATEEDDTVKSDDNSESDTKLNWKSAKEDRAKLKKRQNAIKRCEDKISILEKDLSDIEEEFLKEENQSDAVKLHALQLKKEEIEPELEELYSLWEELSSES
jgi:ABC transporter related protein